MTRLLGALGAVAALVFAGWLVRDAHATMPLFDLGAYRVAGERVLTGGSLYGSPLVGTTRGVFEFVYTPFAALLFTPLAVLPGWALLPVALVVGVGLLAGVVWLSLVGLGHPPSRRSVVLCLGLSGLLLWCEPVWETVTFGQVNLVLAVLVLGDLGRPRAAWGRGALIGVAAGIKLTPAFFVVYLLVTRQFRAAGVAVGAFLATVLVGAVTLPGDSRVFWAGAFADPARVGVPDHPGNQSLRGAVARTLGMGSAAQLLWLVAAAVLACAGLWLAARSDAAGRELTAAALCGLTGVAVSPFSWVHHWVWFVPLLVVLLDRALPRRGRAAWAAWLAFAGVAVVGCHWFFAWFAGFVPGFGGPVGAVVRIGYQNAYVWLTVVLLAVAAWLPGRWRRAPDAAPEPARAPARL
ncbi:MAG TPA: glycosyltransferase 87 family protein [Pseudonocardia sp.]|nr:glycosyltransferase 87 family protein [Pseudonocardia sp.]